jgi:hypothetical protein
VTSASLTVFNDYAQHDLIFHLSDAARATWSACDKLCIFLVENFPNFKRFVRAFPKRDLCRFWYRRINSDARCSVAHYAPGLQMQTELLQLPEPLHGG